MKYFFILAAVPLAVFSTSTSATEQTSLSTAQKSALYEAAASKNRIDIDALPQQVWHHFIMPGEAVNIVRPLGSVVSIDGVPVSRVWTAPLEAGTHTLKALDGAGRDIAEVKIFVLEPGTSIDKNGYIGAYRIGKYPRHTPKGFIKLEKNERGLRVSEHFKVGQFLCKQQPGTWPKYLLVSSDNLIRLEALLSELNRTDNIEADTLFVMSGFRTPYYNSAIGSAKFSRHMYGDAADVYIDTKPRNGTMDDLNGDGVITKADANYLYDYAASLFKRKKHKQGGLGSYKANAVHGPFVHVDARGRPARWGR